MRRKGSIGVLACAAVLLCGSASAALGEEPLSWELCVREAAAANPELKNAEANLRSAEYQRKAARSGYFPQISGSLSASRGNAVNVPGSTGSVPTVLGGGEDSTRKSAALGLTQNIFSGFATDSSVEQAAANQRAAAAALEGVQAQVSYDLRFAFAALLYSQEYLALAQRIIERRDENLRLVELRYQSGNENQGSYLLSKAALAGARLDALQAKHAIGVSRQRLAKVLGRELSERLQIAGRLPVTEPPAAPAYLDLMRQVPAEHQARALKEAADAGVRLAKSQFYPSLDASGEVARENRSGDSDKDRWQAGLSLSIPIFAGGQNYYGAKSAMENAVAAQSSREAVDRQILVNLKETHTVFVEAVERVKVDREYVEAAGVRAEIARAKYNNGLLSFEDWDIIENDLIARQKALLLSERDRVVAEAAWELVRGGKVF